MPDTQTCCTAGTLLQQFRKKELSPLELMQALIARAEAVEPRVNALCFRYFDEALEAARRAEAAWMKGTARPLEGIPVAVKDESLIEGKETSFGSLLMKGFIAPVTDVSIQRLQKAGAIIHARTATPEFSCAFVTSSELRGTTRNPWNLDCTPGGSSGGAGAALASGTTVLATGSDIAGSIRVPAALNGVVGYKPPYGRVPQSSPYNLDPYSQEGPLALAVGDCALMQNVIAGPHASDMASLRPKLRIPEGMDGIRGWRVAWSMDLGFAAVEDDVRRNTLEALKVFQQAGAVTEEVTLGWNGRKCSTTAFVHLASIMGTHMRREFGKPAQREKLTSYLRHYLDVAGPVTPESVLAGMEYTNEMYAGVAAVLETHDVLIVPTIGTTRVAADFDYSRDELRVAGKKVDPFLGWTLTWPFNTLGRCPVLNVPAGLADNGVPAGIQIIGRSYDDLSVFQAGFAYEQALGGPFIRKDRRPPL